MRLNFHEESASVDEDCRQVLRNSGSVPHHTVEFLAASFTANPKREFVLAWGATDTVIVVSAFERAGGGGWSCFFPGEPVVSNRRLSANELFEFLSRVALELDAKYVYFPMVYCSGQQVDALLAVPQVATWPRRPSPGIDWNLRGEDLWERVRKRHGTQAEKKRSRFERNLHVRRMYGPSAADALGLVESRSWKASHKQDMHSRDRQFAFYAGTLCEGGSTELSVVFDNNRPVAYRLDARVASTVFAMKWSFDYGYRRQSPGFYLLTLDLVARWGQEDVTYIDLFGSPDTLKSLVQTDQRPRQDIAWPANAREISTLRAERTRFDLENEMLFKQGFGLRRRFGGGDQ